MFRRVNFIWRLFATALAFSLFGLGGLILRLLVYPLLLLVVRQPTQRAQAMRVLIHHAFQVFIGLMRVLGLLSYEVKGLERLQRQGLLVLANHPTLIDVVFLIALLPSSNCVINGRLTRNPFTRGPVTASRYISNHDGAELISACIQSVQAGDNLIIFPEGTRTPLEGSMKLQRGAANIAIRGQLDITPVHIQCYPRSLTKGEAWWKIPSRPLHFLIEIREDIPVAPFCQQVNEVQAVRALTHYLHTIFLETHLSYVNTRE